MGLLDDILEDDAAFGIHADVLPGVESVTLVTSNGTTSTSATLSGVIVDRLKPFEDGNGFVTPSWRFVFRNDATYGALPSELRSSGTYVIVATNKESGSGTSNVYINTGAVTQDAGAVMAESVD